MEEIVGLLREQGPMNITQMLAANRSFNWSTTQAQLYRLIEDGKVTRRRTARTYFYAATPTDAKKSSYRHRKTR